MKVLFDHQVFDSQTVEGPSRYFVELARHLIEEGVEVEFAVRQTDNVFLHSDARWSSHIVPHQPPHPFITRLRQIGVRAGIVPYMATFSANQAASEAALARGDFDIFHPTYYEPYFLPLPAGKPFIVTVHDMIHELFPKYIKPGNPTTSWKQQVIAAASHLIAVSECTKQDLVRLCNIAPDKVTVVHHGVGAPFTNPVSPEKNEKKLYLLYLGSRDRYKNFSCLLEALPSLRRANPELMCICVGGGEFTTGEKVRMRQLGVDQSFAQVSADDHALAKLYREAAAFIFPSLYEGFGMPILEAMASGCPVILSRASAFPEVAGDAALYFNPQEPADLARAVQELLASPAVSQRLRTLGLQRAAKFSWVRTAQQTLAVYQQILDREKK